MSASSLLIALLLGCPSPPECSQELPCGLTQTCVSGRCEDQLCATSAQCPMEQHCEDGACAAGCAEDTDCYPGERCDVDTATCGAAECTDTHVDCAFQEFCDPDSGDCTRAEGTWCQACDTDDDCGGGGNTCLSWGDNGQYCSVACDGQDDCPSGYSCAAIDDAAGNVQGSWCITWCWLYEDLR